MRPWSFLLGAALVAAASPARADLEQLDMRGPIRVGEAWSGRYGARALSLSFEDEIALGRRADAVRPQLVFGMDGIRAASLTAADGSAIRRSYLGVTFGSGLSWRLSATGPLAVATLGIGPLFENEDLVPHGLGVAARGELYPFYLDLHEAVACTRGALPTWALSGLHGWALGRQDWIGAGSPRSYAFGVGIDLARELLLPVLDALLEAHACDRPRGPLVRE